jgi:phage shock protein C
MYNGKKVNKRLYRSDTNKTLGGILGGLGEYLNIDPTILRLVFVLIVLVTGVIPGVIAYFIGLFIVPKRPAKLHSGSH